MGRATAISVFERGAAAPRACVTAAQIGKLRGLAAIRIGDTLGPGAAAEFIGEQANPFRASVGLAIAPAQAGSGVRFRLGIERGALPAAFQ